MIRFHPGRASAAIRAERAETRLGPEHFVQGLFVVEGSGVLRAVPGLEGSAHVSPDRLVEACDPFLEAGVDHFLLFGVPDAQAKDARGSAATEPCGLVPRAIRALKAARPQATVLSDVCLCAYTDHGHCGILAAPQGQDGALVDNDATLPGLAAMALAHAQAGADWVAPSAMMDGQVAAIRAALEQAGAAARCRVMGYSAKFASAFYGPFRGAAGSAPGKGDRKSYQMDPPNGREAQAEIAADLAEGAQAVMVKPALAYLDVIARARDAHPAVRLAAYHTSGELMALKAAAAAGVCDYGAALAEQLIAIRRAGADWIIGYAAADQLGIALPWQGQNAAGRPS